MTIDRITLIQGIEPEKYLDCILGQVFRLTQSSQNLEYMNVIYASGTL